MLYNVTSSGRDAFSSSILVFLSHLIVSFKGGDHCRKSEKSIFSFLHFLEDVHVKNAVSKFYEEIRKIDGDMVFSVKRCQTRD